MANKFIHNDPLCKKVYNWEDGQWLAKVELFRHKLAQSWIRKASKHYAVKPPVVRFLLPTAKTSGYYPPQRTIGLVPSHLNPVVILHEAAHHICDSLLGTDHEPHHSHEWFSIFMWLLLKFEVYERAFLRESLKAYRLTLRPLGPEKF